MPSSIKKDSEVSKENERQRTDHGRSIKSWFKKSLVISVEQKDTVQIALLEASLPGADFLIFALLSCTIATVGLIADSPSAVIGAMLVGPFMSPILSLSLAYITGHYKTALQALGTIAFGVGTAVALSTILSLFLYRIPNGADLTFTSEILARVSPSLLDFLIALAGGSTMAFAITSHRFSATLPGAAIATALIPPLCTVGIGISFLNISLITGASFLFLINLVGIFFAGALTFTLLGFKADRNKE